MRLVDDHSLLQDTLLRLNRLEGLQAPIVICNEEHRFIVAEQLREIDVAPDAIVLEPVGRNTAPAMAVAGILCSERREATVMLALPADHHIGDIDNLIKAIELGAGLAEKGHLVTFGVEPTSPETGYGYIRKGDLVVAGGSGDESAGRAWSISRFVEKPDTKTAKGYLDSGAYCWNSGMFMFTTAGLMHELETHVPAILAACRKAVADGRKDLDFFRLDKAAFEACPSDSIDYAVMEQTASGVMVSLGCPWNDLGSWEALWQAGVKDGHDNVVHGDVCLQDVDTSFVHASSRLVTAVGLSGHVVVETKDAVFVAPRDHVQQVKALVDQLKGAHRVETISHKKVYRPWGAYEDTDVSERFLVKRITVKPKAKLSLQKHHHRAEHWVVVKGTALVTKGETQFFLREDESTYIPIGTVHRLENPGLIPLELVEVQSGSYLGEDDVVRLDDVYGRHNDC